MCGFPILQTVASKKEKLLKKKIYIYIQLKYIYIFTHPFQANLDPTAVMFYDIFAIVECMVDFSCQ